MRAIYDVPLPDGWVQRELRDVTIRRRGYSWSKERETTRAEPGSAPVIRIPNVGEVLDRSDLLYLRGVTQDDLKDFSIRKDWVIFVGSNGNPARIGDSVLIDDDEPILLASFLQGIAPRDVDLLAPGFLAAWMRLHNVHEAFSRTSQQTTGLANFSWSAVKRLPIRFPASMDEQRAILKIVDDVQDAIAVAELECRSADSTKKSLLERLFTAGVSGDQSQVEGTRWFQSPAHWRRCQLRRVAAIDSGFTMGRDLRGQDVVRVPYLTVVNVQEGYFDLSNVSHTEIKRDEMTTGVLAPGDVLVTEGGDRDKVGRGGIWTGQIAECAYQNHIFRVRFSGGSMDPRLFHFWLQTQQAKRYFFSHAKQTSNLCTINSRELKRLEIAIPPAPEQVQLLHLLRIADALVLTTAERLRALRSTKRSVISSLVSGNLSLRASLP